MTRFRKFRNALLGLAVGLVTLPLGIVAWPAFCAWWLYNETDDDLEVIDRQH